MSGNRTQILLVVACCLTGCVPSLHPVYTEKDVVFVPGLLGTWKQKDTGNVWEFSRGEDSSYRLRFSDSEGRSGNFIAHVAESGGLRFLDIVPVQDKSGRGPFYDYHFVPFHTIYLIERKESQWQILSLDLKWLHKHLAEHPETIQHMKTQDRSFLTAPTPELQAFLRKHRERFTGRITLESRRDTETPRSNSPAP